MKCLKFTIRAKQINALARPGETVTVYADNVEGGEVHGLLIDAYEIEPADEHGCAEYQIVMACEDDEVEKVPGEEN